MNQEIKNLENKGWEVKEKTKKYATLHRPKRFNWTAFIFLSLVLNIFGLVGYLIYYAARKPMDEKIVSI